MDEEGEPAEGALHVFRVVLEDVLHGEESFEGGPHERRGRESTASAISTSITSVSPIMERKRERMAMSSSTPPRSGTITSSECRLWRS